MNIKYADWSKGYSLNGSVAEWNPDDDYGNEYANVYFRVDTTGYRYPEFSFSKEDGENFDKEIVKIFTALGWECEKEAYNGRCSTWNFGKSHLYMHPQEFSGEIRKNEIKKVAEFISEAYTFKLERVDVYETVYDIADEEYEQILLSKDEEIKNSVLDVCKTTRTYNFYRAEEIAIKLANKFRIRRIGNSDGRHGGIGQTARHILVVINGLIQNGYLVSYVKDDKVLVRTINKSEQKQRHLKIA